MSTVFDSAPPPKSLCSAGLERLLIRIGLVAKEESTQLRERSPNRKLLSTIVEERGLNESEVLQAVAADLRIDLCPHLEPDPLILVEFAKIFSKEMAVEYRCLPIRREGEKLVIAASDPLDIDLVQEIEFQSQLKLTLQLASESDILKAIAKFLTENDAEVAQLQEVNDAELDDSDVEILTSAAKEDRNSGDAYNAPPVIRLVNKILLDAATLGASDVHLIPTAQHLEVKYRIDGVMKRQFAVAKRTQPAVINRVKLLSGMNIAERRRPQDGRFRVRLNRGITRDIRASVVPTPSGESIVLRLLGGDLEQVSLTAIRMPQPLLHTFEGSILAPDQVIIVTGPTGSGKTTTLYAALQRLLIENKRIVTVEDPVEFRVEGVTQIQIDTKLGVTFASGLRSILRQDPDAILVGEIRDRETAEIALQAGQTGHLVLTTLHTNDALAAIVRLRDLGVQPYVISASVRAIVAQRLVRTICPKCSTAEDRAEPLALARKIGVATEGMRYGAGCEECEQSGFRGRAPLFSLLVITPEVREAIRAGLPEEELELIALSEGMTTLSAAARSALAAGMTTVEEIERVLGPLWSVERDGGSQQPKLESKSAAVEVEKRRSFSELATEYRSTQTRERRCVLLIDDDEGVRAVLTRLLVQAGYEVHEAADGEHGVTMAKALSPDMVVCDLVMPGMNGEEVVVALRGIPDLGRIPILMLTGSDDEQNEIKLIEFGASDFVSKASSPALVLARIKRLLER